MIRALTLTLALFTLSACDGLSLAKGLLGGGKPGVNANAQIGRTNNQTLGVSRASEQRLDRAQARTIEQSAGETGLRAESVETVVVNETPPWLIVLAFIGWLLPTPTAIAGWIRTQIARLLPLPRKA